MAFYFSMILLFGSIILCSLFISSYVTNLFYFMILFPCIFGLGNGMIYIIPLKESWHYYKKSKRTGLASGIIVCGYGIGCFVFSLISTYLINPKNVTDFSKDLEIINRFPSMMRTMCAIWTVLVILSAMLIVPHQKGADNS